MSLGETQKRILEHIKENPGAYFLQIERALELGMATAQFHLYQLERKGYIWSQGRMITRFYAKEKVRLG